MSNPEVPSQPNNGNPESQQPRSLQEMEHSRQQLVENMVGGGLMSQELADSGVLDTFIFDEPTGHDGLTHILIGDSAGGAHHLRTIVELNVPDRIIASRIVDPQDPSKSLGKLRQRQKIGQDGVYLAGHVDIGVGDKTYEKPKGSSMFPDEWSSEHVINALLETSYKEPTKTNPAKNSATHVHEVDGVRLSVVTDLQTGKIITGFPQ